MKVLALLALAVTACGKPDSLATDIAGPATFKSSFPIDVSLPQLEKMMPGAELPLALGPTEKITAHLAHIERRGPGNFSWTGTTPQHGLVVITARGNAVIGTIVTETATYRIVRFPDGKLHVGQVVLPRRPRLGQPFKHGFKPAQVPMDGDVELIVGYTPAASNRCGDLETIIQHAVDQTNAAALATGIDVHFDLAHTYVAELDESIYSMDQLVDYFAGRGDGKLDEVHQLRDDYFADIAVLFVDPKPTDLDGLSAQTMADADSAFVVVRCAGALDYHTMTHEIGHVFGLNDDIDVPTPQTIPYGYGYPHNRQEEDYGWRTVMSSGASCANGCPHRPLMWSNPAVFYPDAGGHPSGDGSSDDARVFRETAGAVSRFRIGHRTN